MAGINIHRNNNRKLLFSYVIFFICILFIGVVAYKRPYYNWDMLAYMALVIKKEHKDISEVHNLTYSLAKKYIPANEYKYLVDSPVHRIRWAQDPNAFNEVLPFYMVKPLYVEAINLFYKAGFNLPIATVLPSIFSYLLIGLLLFHWLSKHYKLFFAFAVALLIMYSPFMVNIARISSPDGVSSLFLFASFYFILKKPSIIFTFLFLLLSVFTRIDNIIVSILILSLIFFSGKWHKKIIIFQYTVMLLILIVAYILISMGVKEYHWNSLYYPTFIKYYDLTHQYDKQFSFNKYLAIVVSRTISALFDGYFTFFLLLVVIMQERYSLVRLRNLPFEMLFSWLLIITIIIRFILFPDMADRFYISYYLVIFVLFIYKYSVSYRLNPKKVTD